LWALILALLVSITPPNSRWEPSAPRQFAAFVLREAAFVPLMGTGESGCVFEGQRAWSRLAGASPEGQWFERVLAAWPTPAGRVLALAGLAYRQGGGPRAAPLDQMTLPDSVRVRTLQGYEWWLEADIRAHLE
jgi:hypothetical protein